MDGVQFFPGSICVSGFATPVVNCGTDGFLRFTHIAQGTHEDCSASNLHVLKAVTKTLARVTLALPCRYVANQSECLQNRLRQKVTQDHAQHDFR